MAQEAGDLFVGRQEQVDDVLALLQDRRPAVGGGVAIFALGMPGIGKSYLLDHIEARARGLGDGVFVFPRRELAPAYAVRHGPDDVGTLLSTLWRSISARQQFLQVVEQQDRSGIEAFDDFRAAAEALARGGAIGPPAESAPQRSANELVAKTINLNQSEVVTNYVFYQPDGRKRSVEEVVEIQLDLDDRFVRAWATWSARRHVVLTIDDFELLAGSHFAGWLMTQVARLPRLVVVAACAESTVSRLPEERGSEVCHWHLGPLQQAEVEAYFAERFDPLAVAEGIPAVTYRYTDGHPGGVHLVGNLVGELGADTVGPAELRRELDLLPADEAARWSALVSEILKTVSEEPLMQAAEACAAVDTFDARLLADLVGWSDERVSDTITSLQGVGLVQQLRDDAGGDARRFRMRGFIRRAIAASLAARSKDDKLGTFHRLAADHFARRLTAIEEDRDGEYDSWYVYEDLEWQRCKSDWLYHTSQVSGAGYLARARFTLVFLEAFYWWGCYERFDFNHQLLLDWRQTDFRYSATTGIRQGPRSEDEDDELLGDNLTFLLEHYPPGHQKDSDLWAEILERLYQVRDVCGGRRHGKSSSSERRDLRRLGGFLRVFMAHTGRYSSPRRPEEADAHLRKALAAFEDLDDDWMVAWLSFELADHLLEQSQLVGALDLLRQSARRLAGVTLAEQEDDDEPVVGAYDDMGGAPDWDEELVANLWRLHGDVVWADGRTDEAFTSYGHALLHAYRFLGDHKPDPYTARFYSEITSRVAERLVYRAASVAEPRAVADADDGGAAAGAADVVSADDVWRHVSALHAVLAVGAETVDHAVRGALAAGDPVAVAAALFPRGPESAAELRTIASPVMRRWTRFVDQPSVPATAEHVQLLADVPDLPGVPDSSGPGDVVAAPAPLSA